MFNPVEKDDNRGPMIIGIGTEDQGGALKVAGAEKVFTLDDLDFFIRHLGHLVRDGDTLLMVQPKLIAKSAMRVILSAAAAGGVMAQVAGHKPMRCETDAQLSAFRQLMPKDVSIPMAHKLGRPSAIQYTMQQADAIIRAWHQPIPNKLSRVAAAREAERILDLEPETLKPEWVRDLVGKFVGTAQRAKPDSWHGISTETNKEGKADANS
jgi:hypothetical protein